MSRKSRQRPPSAAWQRAEALITPEARAYARLTGDVLDQLEHALAQRELNQRALAAIMGKHASEVNKYFSVGYNFTLRTIAKLEAALETPLLLTPLRYSARQQARIFGEEVENQHYYALRNRTPTGPGAELFEPHETVRIASQNIASETAKVGQVNSTEKELTNYAMAA